MINIRDTSTPVVVLRSESHGGLNIMKSLGPLGVPVYNVDPDRLAPAFWSRYCTRKFLWDIEHQSADASLQYLCEVREQIGRPCILIPTTDRTAKFVAEHALTLAESFIFPQQKAQLVQALTSKEDMFYLARRSEIPTPDAVFPLSREDVMKFLNRCQLPIMLKGIDGQRLWDRIGKKMFVVRSKDELLELYSAAEDLGNPNLMLQEYIPGEDDTVWMFNGYFDAQSDCLVGFTGKKIRQCPVHTGSTSLGICLRNSAVEETTKRFMKAIGYQGILDIGYRYDARNGQYKVLDVNPRIGATFRLFVGENGMDVARALYLDLTNQKVISSSAKEGRKWIVEDLDLVSSYRYYREGSLSFSEWKSSLRGIEEAAFICSDDPLPILAMIISRAGDLISRLLHAGLSALKRLSQSSSRPTHHAAAAVLSSRKPVLHSVNRKAGV